MAYKHGVYNTEQATSLTVPIQGSAGLQVIFGTAPIHLAKDPAAAVNTPKLVYSYKEAVEAVGYSDDFENFTLCQSISACFQVFNVAPIILVNVLDPNKAAHVTQNQAESCDVVDGVVLYDKKYVLLNTLTVKNGSATLVAGSDYEAAHEDDGSVAITLLSTAAKEASSLTVSSTSLKPSGVTAADIVGGVDASTGKETGLELIRQIYPTLGMVPGLILAPGWSHTPTVAAALWPMVAVGEKKYYFSAMFAALTAYTDANNADVPYESPSNKDLRITATVLKDGTTVALDQQQANDVLNANGVITAINANGFKSWGNNTAAYPSTTDPKDRWWAVRRFFDWDGNNFIQTYFQKVDKPGNKRLIQSIVDSQNIIGNGYVARDYCAGYRVEFRSDENPVTNLLAGHLTVHTYLAPYIPAEYIENIREYDVDALESAIGGE